MFAAVLQTVSTSLCDIVHFKDPKALGYILGCMIDLILTKCGSLGQKRTLQWDLRKPVFQ